MSLFKRALGAVGKAGAAVTSKYIDEQLAQQRAQFLADLQRQTAGQIRQDDLSFRTDPNNVRAMSDAERQSILSRGQATREAELAALNDPDYQGAKRRFADDEAAAKRERDITDVTAKATDPRVVAAEDAKRKRDLDAEVARIRAMAAPEAQKAAMIEDARQRARQMYEGDTTPAGKIKMIEDAIGRPLEQAEREALVGLARKPEDDPTRKALEAVLKRYTTEGSDLKADQVGQELTSLLRSLQSGPAEAALKAGVERARQEGKAAEAIAELRSKGMTDPQLAQLFTPEELKAAAPQQPKPQGLLGRARATVQNTDPIASMPTPTLERLAAIEGHRDQQRAKEELQRRRAAGASQMPPVRDAATALNVGA